jgi:hypothetical protein
MLESSCWCGKVPHSPSIPHGAPILAGKPAERDRTFLIADEDVTFPEERPTAWPADGDAGVCPDCNKSVHYTSQNGSYGVWFHDSGTENCEVPR